MEKGTVELDGGEQTDSGCLFRRLVAVALVSMTIIVVAGSFGIYRVYRHYVLQRAGEDAAHITEVLLADRRELFLAGGRIVVEPGDQLALDQSLRRFLHPFQIVKVKMFDTRTRIVYSTDPSIVGRHDSANPRLARALRGEIDSHQERKETVLDLADEQKFDVDVIETYVPIRDGGEVVGSFEVYFDVTRYRDEIRRGVGVSVVVLGGILLLVFGVSFLFVRVATSRLAAAEARLLSLATTDALTGVLNRGTVLAHAQKEFERYGRHPQEGGAAPSLILFDVDHFKRVNDDFGHLVGDRVLRQLSERVQSVLRGYDRLGRYGGEEFLVILPDADSEAAASAAERIRRAVGDHPFVIGTASLAVTVSLGVASIQKPEERVAAVLKRADEGLYLAKRSGRNRAACIESS